MSALLIAWLAGVSPPPPPPLSPPPQPPPAWSLRPPAPPPPGSWLAPLSGSLWLGSPEEAGARWLAETRALLEERRRQPWRFAPARARAPALAPRHQQDLAQLGIAFRGRFELKLDRLRNDRCTAGDFGNPFSGCQPGFPIPFLDQQFTLTAGGVVSQRIHLDLDYDSQREFSANNDLRVWYQGGGGELLQRVEIGNVTLEVPASRFITAGIPANAFGVQARFQSGRFELSSILAQQRGSALRTRVYTIGQTVTQPVEFELRDLDLELGRFFFVLDPRSLPGYPELDILNLQALPLPAHLRPVAVRVYRLRAQGAVAGTNPNLGGIPAVARRRDSPQRVGPLPWELLVEGRDYYLDPSGLWFALATRVGTEDFLAVSYLTAAGDTVGTFPATAGGTDTLELIYEPRRGPEVPTFFHELRNVYRLGGPEIAPSSLELAIRLNQSERPLAGGDTYLQQLGLALAADPAAFDWYNRVFPRDRDPNGGAPVRDRFVVFPMLAPFADPQRLTPAERNDSLYRTPAYLLASQGPPPRFRLRVRYQAQTTGDRSSLQLGAWQIREGSERLFVGDRQLIRGQDYQIYYDIGQVVFTNPEALFPSGRVQLRAQFEENQLFDVAPKAIAGLAGTYRLGSAGRLDAVGLFQQEQSVFTRPQLGFEPRSHLIGGLSADLAFDSPGLSRALDALPLVRAAGPSRLSLTAELAVSRPNANQAGQAYLEEFEGTGSAPFVSLSEQAFQLGSRPSSGRGLGPAYLASDGSFDPRDAVPLVWQNGVSIGGRSVEFEPRDLDSTIQLAGTARQLERVLWLSLKPDTVGGAPDPRSGRPRWIRPHTPGPRWRSLTQALDRSGLGVDLSSVEYLEFWVLEDDRRSAAAAGTTLLLDFGTVLEDAVAPAPDTIRVLGTDTVFSGLQLVGLGRLDTERDTLTQTFNAATDDRGILGDLPDSLWDATAGQWVRHLPLCRGTLATGLPIFPLGDLAARCSRGNGLLDTEDLDGDNRLDLTVGAGSEDLVRYVFPLGSTRYFVREGGSLVDATGRRLVWRLYRIPFRQDSLLIGAPDLRHVRALRLTVVAPDQPPPEPEVFFALARLRLVGAPWVKRAASPLAGLGGAAVQPHGEVIASVVSTENRDLGYTPPPGVVDQADRRGAAFQFASQQVNEHSLRLQVRDLRLGERAEALTRFAAQSDRNFLRYRQLRLWAQGRGAGWDEGDLEFFVKVGSDQNNFYLYRTRLAAGRWEPEIVVELERWIALRAQIESRWLRGESPSGAASCGGDSTAFVACDGPYLVQLRDPGISPPNLASVSEVAAGIYRVAARTALDQAEVWVDDIRLARAVNRPGMAGSLQARLVAADLAEVNLTLARRDDQFHQLDENPTYLTDLAASAAATVHADKLLPAGWGWSLPVTISHVRTAADPLYLPETDVARAGLAGFRHPRASRTALAFDLRRQAASSRVWSRLLLDPLALNGQIESADTKSERWTATTRNRRARAEYHLLPQAHSVRLVPEFLLRALPEWLRRTQFGRALQDARLRLAPSLVRLGSHLVDDDTRRSTFRAPVVLASDSAVRPQPSQSHQWTNFATLELSPLQSLRLRADWSSVRDLADYGDSTAVGRLLARQRSRVGGRDLGFERQRWFGTSLSVAPVVAGWLTPRLSWSSGFSLVRDPNQRQPLVAAGDTVVPVASANFRRRQLGAGLDPARLVSGGPVARLLAHLLPAEVASTTERRSSFDRLPQAPELAYQLGLGTLEALRRQGDFLAATALEAHTLTVAGGARWGSGILLRANYRDARTTTWLRQAERQAPLVQRTRDWPSATLDLNLRPRGWLSRAIGSLNGQAQYRRSRSVVEQGLPGQDSAAGRPAGFGVTTESRLELFSPALTVSWTGGVTTGAQYTRSRSEQVAAGSITRSDRSDWSATASLAVRAPSSLVRLPNAIRATASAAASDTRVCLWLRGAASCTAVADSRRRQLDLRLDTGVSGAVVGGASLSYILTDQRHLSSRFEQYVVTIFAEIAFVTGRSP